MITMTISMSTDMIINMSMDMTITIMIIKKRRKEVIAMDMVTVMDITVTVMRT
jgi:hypothetical protein